eukprot:4106884-Amphidinium_carterae.1
MEPTREEVATFDSMGAVLRWAGVVGDPTDATTEAASLLAHVGFSPADHPRYVAVLSQGRWEQYLTDWM